MESLKAEIVKSNTLQGLKGLSIIADFLMAAGYNTDKLTLDMGVKIQFEMREFLEALEEKELLTKI